MRNFFLKEIKTILLKSTIVLLAGATMFPGCKSKKSILISKQAENPIIQHMYTADPSARVFKDGRLYVYASHDVDPPHGCDLMDQYHVFSTDNMVNWKDHGEIVRASRFHGAVKKVALCGLRIAFIKTIHIIFISLIPAEPNGIKHGKLELLQAKSRQVILWCKVILN